mgnify:FL=1
MCIRDRQKAWIDHREDAGLTGAFDYDGARWMRKRQQILRRDGYQCQECRRYGKAREATQVHHKKHVDEYPELAYKDDNLVSLCCACHNKMHPEKARAARGRYAPPDPGV